MLQINISGTGADETDYVIPLNIHRGPKSGDDTTDDVFMDNTCSEDFSDIRITDADGTQLDCYIHSHGNYEIIQDVVHLGEQNIITAGGKIVASRVQDVTVGIAESNDNGETWDILHPAAATIIWVDPITGHYFANDGDYFGGRLLMRSVDADHLVWNTVLDMTAETGSILPYGFCEDAAGTLFAGRYQLANNAAIFRSIDAGATWQKIYQGDGTKQHIHGLDIDPYTGYLYAGVDGVGAAKQLIRSTNASDVTVAAVDVVFTELVESDAVQMLFGDGWRLFTNETETFNDGIISTVYRTTDDAAFTSEILTGHCGRGITMIGSSIYMTTSAQYTQRYPQLLRRNDDGTWKTIWIANFDEAAGNYGPRMATPEGTPTGGEIQSLISPDSAGLGYAPMRLFDGGDHYQALVYIKIPSLPAAGCTICIHCGSGLGSTIETWSDSFSLPGLFTHYKFEEGAGTDILDATGNGNDAILTPGTGSWDVGGKRVSSIVPDITLDDHSYVFAGDGYAEIPGSDVDPDFQFTKNFTITGWFKSTNADNQMLISKGNIGANHWSVWIWTRFYFRYSAADYYFPPAYLTLVDGGWNFFGVSVDNASVVTVCINGVSFTDPLAQPIVANNSVVRIGSQADGTRGWEGSIDDVQIYHTTPLTADQMRQIYESREFSATEPGAGRTRQIEEENQMGIGRIPIITNYKATELVHLKVNPYGGDPWSMATPVSNFFGNIPVDVDIGVGVPFPLGRIHADQPTADAGIPVVVLDQADLSEGYVDYIGASAASAVGPISSWTTGNTIQGFVRVEVNGVGRWMPYYDDPTS